MWVWLPWLWECPFVEFELELELDESLELVDDLAAPSVELLDDEVLDEPSDEADEPDDPAEPELDADELADEPERLSVL